MYDRIFQQDEGDGIDVFDLQVWFICIVLL
jgi:hypothetical protein